MKSLLRYYTIPLLIGLGGAFLFLLFQARGIYGGDSGDLVTAAFQMGVPHPPGYPLYTFLGWLLSHLPFFTPAWRVTLLSSIPHAIAVSVLYLTVLRLTKKRSAALFSSVLLAGNYLFFLYSTTPEVFALLDLFIIVLIYMLVAWKQTTQRRYLFWASFVMGLSLSHHHVILFFIPALVYWCWTNKSHLRGVRLFTPLVYFFVGLLPYLYIPIAARGNAMVNWDRAVDVSGFVRLVSRQDYGTFVSGGFYGAHLVERILQVQGYIQLLLVDFRWIGIVLAVVGGMFLWKRDRQIFFFFTIALFFWGPLFFFYASFPLFNRFNWGTYERFLLPSYMFLYLLIGIGMVQLLEWTHRIMKRFMTWGHIGRPALILVLFLYPITSLGVTIWRFVGLPSDRTADNLGYDIVTSVPTRSIVLVSRDTPLFTSQYVRYALGVRGDVFLLHANKLASSPEYPAVIAKVFPDLVIPEASGSAFPSAFIKANAIHFPIFTNTKFVVEKGWFWVPHGLLYRLTPENKLPQPQAFYEQNRAIWEKFHDPTKGILSRYNHLMLSDVRDVYASSRIEFGKTMLKAGKLDQAKKELEAALGFGGDTQTADAYLLIGLSELFASRCEEALENFAKAREASLVVDKNVSLYEGITYRDCAGDTTRAKTLLDEYEKLRKKEETPLR
ncbi:DUF2723 domain-containing protein [Candidatus Gottesmanbacteria bacterium]|nr:DUF2723 domain-containing protein [Candidatus Gottesmanbacteria bacterium]